MAQEVIATDAAWRSVQGAQGGLCRAAVTTTAEAFTITEWKGRYVTISVFGAAGYYNFHTASAAGGLDPTATAADTASPDATVPGLIASSGSVRVMVPDFGEGQEVYLLVAAQASTADFRVHRS